MGNPASIFQLIHDTLLQKDNLLTVSELCKCGGDSRSGYYNWEKNAKRRQQQEEADQQDFELVLEAYRYRGYKKGHQKYPYALAPQRHRYESQEDPQIDAEV